MKKLVNYEAVYIEYCNLPMQVAFANKELAGQVGQILKEVTGKGIDGLNFGKSTFRQFVCLNQDGKIPLAVYDKILEVMHKQDEVNPYAITKIYPFLLQEEWKLDMREISYMKVDVRYGQDWYFCVKRIEKRFEAKEGLVLSFILMRGRSR